MCSLILFCSLLFLLYIYFSSQAPSHTSIIYFPLNSKGNNSSLTRNYGNCVPLYFFVVCYFYFIFTSRRFAPSRPHIISISSNTKGNNSSLTRNYENYVLLYIFVVCIYILYLLFVASLQVALI